MAAGCRPRKPGTSVMPWLDSRFRGNETGELVKVHVKPQRAVTLCMPKSARFFTSPRRERSTVLAGRGRRSSQGEVDGERNETAGEGTSDHGERENSSPEFLAALAIRPLQPG